MPNLFLFYLKNGMSTCVYLSCWTFYFKRKCSTVCTICQQHHCSSPSFYYFLSHDNHTNPLLEEPNVCDVSKNLASCFFCFLPFGFVDSCWMCFCFGSVIMSLCVSAWLVSLWLSPVSPLWLVLIYLDFCSLSLVHCHCCVHVFLHLRPLTDASMLTFCNAHIRESLP